MGLGQGDRYRYGYQICITASKTFQCKQSLVVQTPVHAYSRPSRESLRSCQGLVELVRFSARLNHVRNISKRRHLQVPFTSTICLFFRHVKHLTMSTKTTTTHTGRRKSQLRPCIDLHEGKVKQIVGGTLDLLKTGESSSSSLRTNFVSE